MGDKGSESEDGNTQVDIKSTPVFYEAYKIGLFLKKSLYKQKIQSFMAKVEIQGDVGEDLGYVQVCVTLVKLFSHLDHSFLILKMGTIILFLPIS